MRTVPIPLLVGVVIGFVGSVAGALALMLLTNAEHIDSVFRWFGFHYGCSVAELLLTSIALFAVAGRSFGMPRTLVTAAAWATVATLAWARRVDGCSRFSRSHRWHCRMR